MNKVWGGEPPRLLVYLDNFFCNLCFNWSPVIIKGNCPLAYHSVFGIREPTDENKNMIFIERADKLVTVYKFLSRNGVFIVRNSLMIISCPCNSHADARTEYFFNTTFSRSKTLCYSIKDCCLSCEEVATNVEVADMSIHVSESVAFPSRRLAVIFNHGLFLSGSTRAKLSSLLSIHASNSLLSIINSFLVFGIFLSPFWLYYTTKCSSCQVENSAHFAAPFVQIAQLIAAHSSAGRDSPQLRHRYGAQGIAPPRTNSSL